MMVGLINEMTRNSSSSLNDRYQYSMRDLELLYRFHNRTLLTIGPPQVKQQYQRIYAILTYSVSRSIR